MRFPHCQRSRTGGPRWHATSDTLNDGEHRNLTYETTPARSLWPALLMCVAGVGRAMSIHCRSGNNSHYSGPILQVYISQRNN
jgi:hypothetical protein